MILRIMTAIAISLTVLAVQWPVLKKSSASTKWIIVIVCCIGAAIWSYVQAFPRYKSAIYWLEKIINPINPMVKEEWIM